MMKTILIIEDEPQVRANIQEILDLADFNTLVAEDGQEGMCLAQSHHPDLVICDVMMPKQDGYAVLETLRANDGSQRVPFIFVTAKAEREALRKGMDLGADDYLTKPFTAEELLNAVTSRLEKQKAADEFAKQQMDHLRGSIASFWPHELNTPLNGILSASYLLGSHSDPEVREIADMIFESSGRLVRLTQNFLAHADLKLTLSDPERVRMRRESAAQRSTALHVVGHVADKKARKEDRVEDLQLEVQGVSVPLPEEQIVKIVEELADNAFKFSPMDTPVEVRAVCDAAGLTLSVTNAGTNISLDKRTVAGDDLEMDLHVRASDGAGLGLGICEMIAELYEGELNVRSDGSEITVSVVFPAIAALPSS